MLYPAARSAHVGKIRLIVAAGRSTASVPASIDGKPVGLERMDFDNEWQLPGKLRATSALVGDRAETTLWVAEASPEPGNHRIVAGSESCDIHVALNRKSDLPPGWKWTWSHRRLDTPESGPDCAACHSRNENRIGSVMTPKVCAPCHDETSVQLIHGHVPGPLAKCAMCHDPHGASLPKLLVDTKAKLCTKCHSAGHFRG